MKTSRKKLVISGLWTSMCFAYSALHALKEGLEVYGLMDVTGDSTPDRRNAHHHSGGGGSRCTNPLGNPIFCD